MRTLTVILSACVLVLAGCLTIPREYNWDTRFGVDLTEFESFRIDPPEQPSDLSDSELNLWSKRVSRVEQLIREGLTSRGYREEEEGQMNVSFTGSRELRYGERLQEFALQIELNIFVTDQISGKWLWHAWSSEVQAGAIDLDEEIEITVPKTLEPFPARGS